MPSRLCPCGAALPPDARADRVTCSAACRKRLSRAVLVPPPARRRGRPNAFAWTGDSAELDEALRRPALGETRRTRVNGLYGALAAAALQGHPLAALPHGSAVLVELGRLRAVLDAERFTRLVAALPAVPNVKALARSLRALRLGRSPTAALEIDSEGALVPAKRKAMRA